MSGTCAKCGKHSEKVVEIMWKRGPKGNRRYKICDRCQQGIERENQGDQKEEKA